MKRRGFTLVELLIVVIILGILAAVVIPQFSDASTDAKVSSLTTNLATVRGQLELYRMQHNGAYPAAMPDFVLQMTAKTNADGTPGGTLGPYLQRIPNNPFTIGATPNEVSAGAAASNKAWFYNPATGEFKANDSGSTNGVDHDTY